MHSLLAAAVLGLVGVVLLGGARLFARKPMPALARILLVGCLLAPIPFALFGFAATFEPAERGRETEWLAWRFGYATVVLGAVAGALWVLATKPRRAERSQDGKRNR